MPFFGVLPVDKPAGVSSRRVVDEVQRIIEPDRVGHTGTLDPLATGVLLLALGNATRLVEYAHDMRKRYEATFEFGKSSDTLDVEGDVSVMPNARIPSLAEVQSELERWVGCVQQVPPQFSAINVRGKRAYQLARRGREFELPARDVVIYRIEILQYEYPQLQLDVECGSGTYIRSLGRDVGAGLGTSAIMTALRRTQVGPFGLEDCISEADLKRISAITSKLASPVHMLVDWQSVELSETQAVDTRHGRQIQLNLPPEITRCMALDQHGKLVALLEPAQLPGNWRSLRVFQIAQDEIQPIKTKIKHRPES